MSLLRLMEDAPKTDRPEEKNIRRGFKYGAIAVGAIFLKPVEATPLIYLAEAAATFGPIYAAYNLGKLSLPKMLELDASAKRYLKDKAEGLRTIGSSTSKAIKKGAAALIAPIL